MGDILRTPITDRSAWRGEQLRHDTSWYWNLPASAIRDIDAALAKMAGGPVPLIEMTRADMPLPSIERELAALVQEFEHGRGFIVIRGLPLERYTDDQVARIFWGIGQYIGNPISQNAQGDLLGHVKDVGGLTYGAKNVRGYQTTAELNFHNDNCDVVGLLCFRKARAGGVSRIASATAIYNEVLERRPEHLDLLYRGFRYDLRGEERAGVAPITGPIPIYSFYENKLSMRYVYTSIMQATRKGGFALTAEETAALTFLNETAGRQDVVLEMMMEPGDMQFCFNHTVLHSRTTFEEWDEPERKRHLLRLWLNVPNGRKLAPEFSDRYGAGPGLGVPPPGGQVQATMRR
jgi:Taurine catabolism dioxygenase TauD, TfdA family